jgi:DNA-binding NtrC family response regulator
MFVANPSSAAVNRSHETPCIKPVRVLAVSPFSRDHITLQSIFNRSNWVLRTASTYAEALAILSEDVVPVVIVERDVPPYSWKDVLTKVALLTNPSRLIVASDNADPRLWGEVLNLGAYDVLAKPFKSAELFASVSSAWRAWRDGEAMRRHYCDTNAESTAVPSESPLTMRPMRKPPGPAVPMKQQLRSIGR